MARTAAHKTATTGHVRARDPEVDCRPTSCWKRIHPIRIQRRSNEMPRLSVVTPEKATGQTKELYDGIKRAVGAVPNIYQGVGSSVPALEALLHIGEALKRGGLTAAEIEAIKLVVTEAYGCAYCLAAHSLLGKKARLTDQKRINIHPSRHPQPNPAP